MELKQQPDRASCETVLAAFFDEIADDMEPLLRNFSNQAFFDDVIGHRFTPGDTYDTCHKGFSPLAFLPRTHEEVSEENANQEHYNESNVKTVGDVRKHRTKGLPPIPASDAELLRLNARDVAILTAFFTKWSDLVIQEVELNDGLKEQQMDLFSNPSSTREMIPQFMWAKNQGAPQVFMQTCNRDKLDVDNGTTPTIAKARLSGHTMIFLLGTQVNIVRVPQQWLKWLKNGNMPGPAKRARHDPGNSERITNAEGPPQTDGRYGPPSTEGHAAGKNLAGPAVFANSREVNELLRKFPLVPMTLVAKEAGFSATHHIPTDGLPARRTCIRWISFGNCPFPYCKNNHLTMVDKPAAEKLYRALLPGIKKVCALPAIPSPTPRRN
jgi:hypothetical protein